MGKRPPEKAGPKQARDAGGRFRPGTSGNPRGKPKGARHKATRAVLALLDGKGEDVVRALIEAALKKGDTTAGIAILRTIAPPPRDRLIDIDLPALETAADLPTALAAIVGAIGNGEITPIEGAALADLFDRFRAAFETVDLEARVTALEKVDESL